VSSGLLTLYLIFVTIYLWTGAAWKQYDEFTFLYLNAELARLLLAA
jgi:hypothetical protein